MSVKAFKVKSRAKQEAIFSFFLSWRYLASDLEKWQLCAGRSRWEAANLCRRRSTTHKSYFRISYSAEVSFPPTDAQIIMDAFESQDVNSLYALWQTTPSSAVWIWKEARLLQQNEVLLLHSQILSRTSQTFYFFPLRLTIYYVTMTAGLWHKLETAKCLMRRIPRWFPW